MSQSSVSSTKIISQQLDWHHHPAKEYALVTQMDLLELSHFTAPGLVDTAMHLSTATAVRLIVDM